MLVMKVGDLDPPSPSIGTPSKSPRWGSIRQRFNNIGSKDDVDDAMWDKNDAAFLEEVARSSPLIGSDGFDNLMMPPLAQDALVQSATSSSIRVNGLPYDANDPLYKRQLRSSTSTASSSTLSSLDDLSTSSKASWINNLKILGSAVALPDLPEQPRPESSVSTYPTSVADSSNAAASPASITHSTFNTNLYPSHTSPSAPSTRSSYQRSSPGFLHIDPNLARNASLADQYPRSPSLRRSPSPSTPGLDLLPLDERSQETQLHWDTLHGSEPQALPADLFEVRIASRLPTSDSATVLESHASVDEAVTVQDPTNDNRADASSPQSHDMAKTINSSPKLLGNRRRSSTIALGSPLSRQVDWDSLSSVSTKLPLELADLTMPNGLSSELLAQTEQQPAHPHHHQPLDQLSPLPSTMAVASPRLKKHGRSKSTLVTGLRKLMGIREAPTATRIDTAGSPSSYGFADLRRPSVIPKTVTGDVQIVASFSSQSLDSFSRSSNVVGNNSPKSVSIRQPAALSLASRQLQFAVAAETSTAGSSVKHLASLRTRTMSIDGFGKPFREAITNRMRSQSSAGLGRGSHKAAAAVIEHISFDEARRRGPLLIHSHDSIQQLRSAPSSSLTSIEPVPDIAVAGVRSPIRPSRGPRAANLPQISIEFPTGQSTTLPAWPTSHPQVLKTLTRDPNGTIRATRLHHRSPPSSPQMPSFASLPDSNDVDVVQSGTLPSRGPSSIVSGETQKLGHNSRRSFSSLGTRTWSHLLSSPILSSSGSSSSHHKRLSTASISRPLSVSSSAFSDTNEIAADLAEDLATVHEAMDTPPRQKADSSGPESSPLFQNISTPRQGPITRTGKGSANSRRPLTSITITRDSGSPVIDCTHPSLSRSFDNTLTPGPSSRPTSVGPLSFHKRPSFGLAIEPDASSAFDSIPSPLLQRRGSSSTERERPVSPRPNRLDDEKELGLDLLIDRPPASPTTAPDVGSFASVPLDEGESPRQRALGPPSPNSSAELGEMFFIHSVNEEKEAPPPQTGRMSQATKDITFGSIAGMFSKVFEHPFDLVKVRLQTQSVDAPPRYSGALDCFRQTYTKEGLRGLYRGLSMPVLGATLENACLFFTYNQIQSVIRSINGGSSSNSSETPLSIAQLAIAAAGAGSVTSLALTPIELIKCKMQVQMLAHQQSTPVVTLPAAAAASTTTTATAGLLRTAKLAHTMNPTQPTSSATFRNLDGPLALIRRTIQTDGLRGLWHGQTATMLRETGGGIAWFLSFESCTRYLLQRQKQLGKKENVSKKDLSSLELICAGALAGVSYNLVLFPADCIKSTMQTEQELGSSVERSGFFQTFQKIYRSKGVKGLYAGCGITCLRAAPSSALIFWMYNKLEQTADRYGL